MYFLKDYLYLLIILLSLSLSILDYRHFVFLFSLLSFFLLLPFFSMLLLTSNLRPKHPPTEQILPPAASSTIAPWCPLPLPHTASRSKPLPRYPYSCHYYPFQLLPFLPRATPHTHQFVFHQPAKQTPLPLTFPTKLPDPYFFNFFLFFTYFLPTHTIINSRFPVGATVFPPDPPPSNHPTPTAY